MAQIGFHKHGLIFEYVTLYRSQESQKANRTKALRMRHGYVYILYDAR